MKKLIFIISFFLTLAPILADAQMSGNATRLQGKQISNTAPSDNQCLVFDAATNKWTPDTCSAGSGDVVGPATNTDAKVPQWDGANSKTLKDGLAITYWLIDPGSAERGDVFYTGASGTARLPHGTAGNPLISGGSGADPSWLAVVLAGGTNTFSLTNGTASFSVGAGKTLNVTGTLTDGNLCKYTASGTVLSCDFTLAAPGAIGGSTPAAGTFTTLTANTSLTVGTAGGSVSAADGVITFADPGGTTENLTVNLRTENKATLSSGTGAIIGVGTQLNLLSSDADPATTAGGIKHDSSDTNADTAARGTLKWFDGTNVRTVIDSGTSYTVVVKTEYLPVAYMEDGAAAPGTAAVTASTRKVRTREFAADADDDVEIHWMIPDDYVGGIKFRPILFVTNATAPADTETVIFNLAGCSIGASDALGCTLGTGVTSTFTADATYAQYDRVAGAWSAEITVTNATAGESAMLKLFRDVDDTYGQAIGLAGIEIKYKAKIRMADSY